MFPNTALCIGVFCLFVYKTDPWLSETMMSSCCLCKAGASAAVYRWNYAKHCILKITLQTVGIHKSEHTFNEWDFKVIKHLTTSNPYTLLCKWRKGYTLWKCPSFIFFFKPNNYDIKHMKHNGGILNPSQLCTPVKEKGESFGLLGNENSHLLWYGVVSLA